MNVIVQNPDVIVVGAGAAGLSAASMLRAAGVETLVLEAAAHVGGRCVTDNTIFDTAFDLGGSWLHSAPINPLARLAEQRGAELHKSPWVWSKVQTGGYDLSPEEVRDYQNYQKEMWHAINQRGGEKPDVAISNAMPQGKWSATAICSIPQMLSGDADVTSAEDTHNYAAAEGDWLVGGGLGSFVHSLHSDVPVQLNCPVQKIDYSGAGVSVTTPQGVVQAKHLILTVSTGVLAAETIEFVPPLPPSKSHAIDMLPNGLLNKIGIDFDPAWKEATQRHMVDFHTSGDEFCSLMFGFFDTNLAVGFVAGRFADELEQQGTGAAIDFCLQGLRATFGNDVTSYVRGTYETAWRGNSNAFGSYSYAKPGGAGNRSILAEPLADRVFFAGEAIMRETYSTVHGAFLSGQETASRIIEMLGLGSASHEQKN